MVALLLEGEGEGEGRGRCSTWSGVVLDLRAPMRVFWVDSLGRTAGRMARSRCFVFTHSLSVSEEVEVLEEVPGAGERVRHT